MTDHKLHDTVEDTDGKRYTAFAKISGAPHLLAVADKDGRTLYYCTKHRAAFSPMHTNDCPECAKETR